MHILIINYEYPPLGGGGAVGTAILAEALADRGHQVTVITSNHSSKGVKTTCENGVDVIRIPVLLRDSRATASLISMGSFNVTAPIYVWARRRQIQADVVNTHFAVPTGPAGHLIARILKSPHVMTLVGGEIYRQPLETEGYRNPFIPWTVRFVSHAASLITAISQDTRQGAQRFSKIRKPIYIAPYPFAPPGYLESPPAKEIVPETYRLVAAGRLVHRKGYDILIRALSHLKDLQWELRILGDGPQKDNLEALADRLGIGDRVFCLGFLPREQFWDVMAQSDLFILATLHEGLGLVYHEAMYCGMPIVTTNNGGQTDFLSEPRNALLAPIADVEAFTHVLQKAMTDPGWFIKASKNNVADVQRLSVDVVVQDWERIYHEALAKWT